MCFKSYRTQAFTVEKHQQFDMLHGKVRILHFCQHTAKSTNNCTRLYKRRGYRFYSNQDLSTSSNEGFSAARQRCLTKTKEKKNLKMYRLGYLEKDLIFPSYAMLWRGWKDQEIMVLVITASKLTAQY